MLAAPLFFLLQAAAQPQTAPVEVRSEGAMERRLTIYRDDLAFVSETHRVEVPAGRSRIVFEGVNDRLVPQTVTLLAFEGLTIERNFDAALLSKSSLFESLVGETAILTRTNPGSGEVTDEAVEVVSADRGVVLRTEAGIETLNCTGLPQKLSAAERPSALLTAPELSILVEAEEAGSRTLTVAYLADGIGWSADYVLTVGKGDGTAGLRGWLTFTNETNDRFEDTPAAIVAGTLQTLGETESPELNYGYYRAACWPLGQTSGPFPSRTGDNPYLLGFPEARERRMPAPQAEMAYSPAFASLADEVVVTGSRIAREERFGDYRLFRPPGPVTLAPYRTKQVRFLEEAGIAVADRYDIEIGPRDQDTDGFLDVAALKIVDNSREGALGRALPAGTVRVMAEAGGTTLFLGQDEVRDLAVGLPVEIATGRTTAVSAELKTVGYESGAGESSWQAALVLRNALDRPAPVRLTLPDWPRDFTGFEAEVAGFERVEGEAFPTWDVTVPPGSARRLAVMLRWER